MKNFQEIIGADAKQLREVRVKNAVQSAEVASRQKVEAAKQDFRNMQMKLADMLDVGATNTQDIATHLKGFDAQKFVNELYPTVLDMAVKSREVTVLITVHNQLFPDSPVSQLDKDDLSIISSVSQELANQL